MVISGQRAQKKILLAGAIFTLVSVILFVAVIVGKTMSDPNIGFLLSEQGADWIRPHQPTNLLSRNFQHSVHAFRRQFTVKEVPRKAILSFRAMQDVALFLDRRLLYSSDTNGLLACWAFSIYFSYWVL